MKKLLINFAIFILCAFFQVLALAAITGQDHVWLQNELVLCPDGKYWTSCAPDNTPAPGSFSHGQTYAITGTGFGTKSTPEPLVYDDFESGTLSAAIVGQAPVERAIGGSWVWDKFPDGAQSFEPVYSNAVLRPNSTRSALMHFEGSMFNNSLEIMHQLPNTGDTAYISFWHYYDRTSANWSRNHKPWVVYGSQGTFPEAYVGYGNPTESDGWIRNSIQDSGINATILYGDVNISGIEAEWIRHEFYLKQSGNNTADGVWHHVIHRTNTPEIILNENEQSYITRSSADYWQQWHFGSYHDNDSTGATGDVYVDNIYFDTTPQRVELCDSSTWAARTKCSVQVAKTWADTEISITVNVGPFSVGDTVYLYPIDGNNNVINTSGQAVTVE